MRCSSSTCNINVTHVKKAVFENPDTISYKYMYCLFVYKWRVVFVIHCDQNCGKGNFGSPIFSTLVDRVSETLFAAIELRRVFLCYVNILTRIFGHSMSFPGLYGGLYGQNLPYKFKNRMVIFRIATLKNHIELLVPGQIWAWIWDWIRDPGQILV